MENQEIEFSEITNNIRVTATPSFNRQESNENQNLYLWFYFIRIENLGSTVVQMLKRRWQIYDSSGKVEEVKGEGLVGYQPIIKPQEFFEYKSQVRLFSTSGLMMGEYTAINVQSNEEFSVTIPPFSLDVNIPHDKLN